MAFDNWEVAAAIFIEKGGKIHYKEMRILVQAAQLSKLGGNDPDQTMRTVLGSQDPGPEYFDRNLKGLYSIKESKKNAPELKNVKQAYQQYLNRLRGENDNTIRAKELLSPLENDSSGSEEQNIKSVERGNHTPDRQRIEINRIIRGTKLAKEIKNLVGNRCQLCEESIILSNGKLYSEAHHIKPLGEPYNGPDVQENIIVLCPNCHVVCDYRTMPLNTTGIKNNLQGIGEEFLAFHNELYYGL